MFEFEPVGVESAADAVIKVIGVGGGGGNAVNHMAKEVIHGVEFYAINTDIKALRKSEVTPVQIGEEITKGLGAGAKPNVGKAAAEADREAIRKILEGADMVFIAAGMGGGTGTGAAPIVAEIAKELNILTVAVVTKPFVFEGKPRMRVAEEGIAALGNYVDSLIIIPNEKLLKVLGPKVSLLQAFSAANDILHNAVRGISDMIVSPGLVNVDFADVKTVMSQMGNAMMGTGVAEGEPGDGRAEKAAQEAVNSPLLEDIDLTGARGVLVNVTSGLDFALGEYQAVGDTVSAFASDDAIIVVGTSLIPEMENEIRVTVVATGIGYGNDEPKVISPKIPPVTTGFERYPSSQNPENKMVVGGGIAPAPKEEDMVDINDLMNTPTFMRKQAD